MNGDCTLSSVARLHRWSAAIFENCQDIGPVMVVFVCSLLPLIVISKWFFLTMYFSLIKGNTCHCHAKDDVCSG